jgi:hypothetical protein
MVSVPVLSEQIICTLPSVSTLGNDFTTACCLAIAYTPIAKDIVTHDGKPSGIAAYKI